ncbi:MAG: hypothetical protein U0746_00220 [Gemmataceae bacterium]
MRRLICVVATGWLASGAIAQEGKGVQPGQRLPGPFPAYVVTAPAGKPSTEAVQPEERVNLGDRARVGKFHDFVTHFGLAPTVAIVSRSAPPAADQPLAKLVQALDKAVEEKKNARLNAFVVFLGLKGDYLKDDTRVAQVKAIEAFADQLKLKNVPTAIDLTESARTKSFGIGAETPVTVFVYDGNHMVKARFDLGGDKPLDDAAVKAVLDEVAKLVGPLKK